MNDSFIQPRTNRNNDCMNTILQSAIVLVLWACNPGRNLRLEFSLHLAELWERLACWHFLAGKKPECIFCCSVVMLSNADG